MPGSDVWNRYPLAQSFWVTVQLAGIATLGSMLFTPAAAYAFQFLNFPFRRTLLVIIINAFVLPQQVVVIPLFTLWRQMGLIDNIASVLIPYVGLSFAWSIFLVKNFLEDFPKELIEAARIDGCGPISTFFRVVLPNSLASDLHRRHPAVPVLLELAADPAALPAARGAAAGDLRPDLGHLRHELGPACRGGDRHHHRPAHRLSRLPTSVCSRRA